jgi:drug/metabolite transporter (DMT)-like permease
LPLNEFTAKWRLHLVVFVWGFTAILGRLISLDAVSLVWHRMLIASAVFMAYLLITKKIQTLPWQKTLPILSAGLVIALHWITFFLAIKIANVSITLAAMSTAALFASVLEPVFFKRKIDKLEIGLGLIVVGGLYLIFRAETDHIAGILVALLSAFLSALFSVINGKLVKRYKPVTITTYELIGGVLGISVFLLVLGKFSSGELFSLTHCTEDGVWGILGKHCDLILLLILGSVCTAWAFIESVSVMKYLSPYTVVLSINMEPVYGIILAFLFFGESERMDPLFYVGTVVILSAIFTESAVKKRRRKKIMI